MAPTAPNMYNDTEKTANKDAAKSLREAVKRYRSRTKYVYNKTTIIGTSSGLTNCLAYTLGKQSTNWATPTVKTAGATPGRCVCSPGAMSGTMWAHVLPPRVPEAVVVASTQESDWKLLGLTQCDVMDRSW